MDLNSITNWFGSSLILGNTPEAYGYALAAFAVALVLIYLIKGLGISRLKALAEKTETDLDDLLIALTEKFTRFEYQLAAFFVATRYLQRAPSFDRAVKAVILLVFTYRAITIIQELLSYWINKVAAKRELSGHAKDSVVRSTQVILRSLVWVGAILFLLDNLGVNISAVLTGLGIGGVAVALAAQAILGDLFNFFVILLDKPFNIGDFIISDSISGTIEHIGLKSTRIRSLSGEMVVISNSNLLGSRIRNYQDLTKRRVTFKTGIVYGTKPELLRKIPSIVKKAVTACKAEFDRCNLSNCGDFSLDFETVYYLSEPDYNAYMAAHEQVLLAVLEGLAAAGAELAYPTQTLLVKK
ncbi:MAG: mechanosensitive ion channel family protein [Elusimicrobiota bacterium]|nr:mechanosensitive ion channel family protein [Elusimicrobiota bacterium]